MKKTIFLTGATGLVGSHLLKTFLKHGHKVYVLARGKGRKSAKERVQDIVSFWDKGALLRNSQNLCVLEGDITQKNFGLNKSQKGGLFDDIEEIFHSAAITDLNRSAREMKDANVTGTRNVLDWARDYRDKGRPVKVNHISTAYLCGDYDGVFNESSLDVGQKFTNNYEETKFRAEVLVEEYRKKGLWIDIYRPPIVIGDSSSGKTFQFKHFYQFIELCSLGLFDTLPVLNAYVSLVPIDLLSKAIYLISIRAKEKSKTYHPFGRQRIPIAKVISCCCRLMDIKKPRAVSLADFNMHRLTPAQKKILQNNILAFNFKNKLDSRRTCKVLRKTEFLFPKINDQLITRMLKYFIRNRKLNKGLPL